MAQEDGDGIDGRGALQCMIWAGIGVALDDGGRHPALSPANAQPVRGFRFLNDEYVKITFA